jgi:1-acyl-sn-glycerol-3-phosphate acyltransferase
MDAYLIVRWLGNIYLRVLRGLVVRGRELVAREGALIICPNHVDWVDPVAIACATPRSINFMAKSELFQSRLLAWFFRSLRAFPVKRGESDRLAVRFALEVLYRGGALGIFPEGTRSRTGRLLRPEPGAATIALKTGATIIPAGITGSSGSRPVIVTWGKPFKAAEITEGRNLHVHAAIQVVTDEIMARIAALTGQEPAPPLYSGLERDAATGGSRG